MNSYKSGVQEVLVDVPKYDKDGNPIPFHLLSSGGARNADGSFIAQYRNPRPPEPANEPEVDRKFHEYNARRRREEAAEERRRKEDRDFIRDLATIVADKVVTPLIEKVIVPRATELWDTKVLPEGKRLWDSKVRPGGKRLGQRVLRRKISQAEVPDVSGDTPEFAAETANPLATSQHNTDHTTEISTVQEGGEDSPLADVIQMDEYQNRRSA